MEYIEIYCIVYIYKYSTNMITIFVIITAYYQLIQLASILNRVVATEF